MSKRLEAGTKALWVRNHNLPYEAMQEGHKRPYRREAQAVLDAADEVMFSGEAVERVAEAMWVHRPMERVYDEGPNMGAAKPWADLKPYQHDRYRAWAAAALAALKESLDV